VRADVTGASLKEFLAEIAKIRQGGITEDEASKAREMLHAEAVRGMAELSSLLGVANEQVVNGLPFEQWSKDLAALDGVKADALNALAHDAIPLERGVLVLVGDKEVVLEQIKGLGLPEPVEVDARGEPSK
jgi:predicted Zn-dependent peptidase